jgi:hypothetical protein
MVNAGRGQDIRKGDVTIFDRKKGCQSKGYWR